MSSWFHSLIEQYGLIAVFLGCLAEGESAAILAGFFAHQQVFVAWQAFAVAFVGAFLGDAAFFAIGRRYAGHDYVTRLRTKPGFSHAYALVEKYPAPYVLLNRYAYGFRVLGGVVAGLSSMSVPKFLVLNALSAMIWASLFGAVGWFSGLGIEALLGDALAHHQRLLAAVGLGLAAALAAWWLTRRYRGRR